MLIYSKKNKKKILGVIFRYKNISKNRFNISPIKEFIQASTQKLKKIVLLILISILKIEELLLVLRNCG